MRAPGGHPQGALDDPGPFCRVRHCVATPGEALVRAERADTHAGHLPHRPRGQVAHARQRELAALGDRSIQLVPTPRGTVQCAVGAPRTLGGQPRGRREALGERDIACTRCIDHSTRQIDASERARHTARPHGHALEGARAQQIANPRARGPPLGERARGRDQRRGARFAAAHRPTHTIQRHMTRHTQHRGPQVVEQELQRTRLHHASGPQLRAEERHGHHERLGERDALVDGQAAVPQRVLHHAEHLPRCLGARPRHGGVVELLVDHDAQVAVRGHDGDQRGLTRPRVVAHAPRVRLLQQARVTLLGVLLRLAHHHFFAEHALRVGVKLEEAAAYDFAGDLPLSSPGSKELGPSQRCLAREWCPDRHQYQPTGRLCGLGPAKTLLHRSWASRSNQLCHTAVAA